MSYELEPFITRGGYRIYRIPLELFPDLRGFVHLVIADELQVLVDVGSGFGDCNQQLEDGLHRVASEYGEPVDWQSLTHVLITHGHIDHHGGLHFVRERSPAAVGVHELDLRVLTGYEERVATMAGRLRNYFVEAGVEAEQRKELLEMYLLGKQLFRSSAVDFTFEAAGMQLGPLRLSHVPGHSPGQVTVTIDEMLLAADHVLPETSPHLAPEHLSLHTGMSHYLDSIRQTWRSAGDIRLALGGHEQPFGDLAGRIGEIWNLYRSRLGRVLELLEQPQTLFGLAEQLFGETAGYHRLLALEEAGAYVEYLQQRGYLAIDDHQMLERGATAPWRYRRIADERLAIPLAMEPTAQYRRSSRVAS